MGCSVVQESYCGFQYNSELIFFSTSFGITSQQLLQFRIAAAIFHWSILIIRFTETERLPPLYYLTNLIYLCCTMYYTIAAYNTALARKDPKGHVHSAPIFRMDQMRYEERTCRIRYLFIFQWLLYSIATNLSILVSIMYFLIIYNPEKDHLGLTNISRHVLNSVFILFDFTFNSLPVKLVHIVWPLIFAVAYIIHTMVFWYAVSPPENYIYPVVDWDKPTTTIKLLLFLVLASLLIQSLLIGAFRTKCYFFKFREHWTQRENAFQV